MHCEPGRSESCEIGGGRPYRSLCESRSNRPSTSRAPRVAVAVFVAVALAGAAAVVVAAPRAIIYRSPQVFDLGAIDGADNYVNAAIGDVDGDGRADIVLAGQYTSIHALRGAADGSAEATISVIDEQLRGGRGQRLFSAVDADGDGDIDVLAGSQNEPVLLYRNDGAGAFTEITGSLGDDILSGSVVPLDLGGDGDLDVIATVYRLPYRTDDGVRVFENTGTSFVAAQRFLVPQGGSPPRVADLNADGLDDVVVVRATDAYVYLQTPAGALGAPVIVPLSGGGAGSAAIDVDGDGDVDVIANARLLRNDGSGALSEDPDWLLSRPLSNPVVVDFDNDGLDDIVDAGTGIRVELLRNTGGAFAAVEEIPSGLTAGNGARFAIGDLDEDGRADLVLADYSSATVAAARQAGAAAPRELTVAPGVISTSGPVSLSIAGSGLIDGATVDLGAGIVTTSVSVPTEHLARVDLVVDAGIGGGTRTLRFANPDLQVTSATVELRSIDVLTLRGNLRDTAAPARDVLSMGGRFPRNTLSAHDTFAGREGGLRIDVGGGPTRLSVAVPADDPRWRTAARGRRLQFRTLRDEFPRVAIHVDTRRETFRFRVSFFDYPQVPADATVRVVSGTDIGRDAGTWGSARRARRFVLR